MTRPRKRPRTQRYSESIRQTKKRFLWSEPLHRRFIAAIFDHGLRTCTPKVLFDIIHGETNDNAVIATDNTGDSQQRELIEQLTSDHIKSHLQKYRANMKSSRQEFLNEYEKALRLVNEGSPQAQSERKYTLPNGFSTYPIQCSDICHNDSLNGDDIEYSPHIPSHCSPKHEATHDHISANIQALPSAGNFHSDRSNAMPQTLLPTDFTQHSLSDSCTGQEQTLMSQFQAYVQSAKLHQDAYTVDATVQDSTVDPHLDNTPSLQTMVGNTPSTAAAFLRHIESGVRMHRNIAAANQEFCTKYGGLNNCFLPTIRPHRMRSGSDGLSIGSLSDDVMFNDLSGCEDNMTPELEAQTTTTAHGEDITTSNRKKKDVFSFLE